MTATIDFILASASPRRAEILQTLGLRFEVRPQAVDESRMAGEPCNAFVKRLACEKAESAALHAELPVLAADTIVVIDDEPLGKPAGQADAIAMLRKLSGRSHEVMTAVAVAQGGRIEQALSITTVTFKPLTENEMAAYWETGEPVDKAGGYGIQGLAGSFVTSIEGSYSAVVGLPVYETSQLLAKFGVSVL